MAWAESGLFGYPMQLNTLTGVVGTTYGWLSASNYFFLTSNSDTIGSTGYAQTASTLNAYTSTYEVSGTGWAAGGIAVSALAAGPGSLSPSFTVTAGNPTTIAWAANNVSVASTTLSNAYGGYFYSNTNSPKYRIIGIYFGGSGYSTTAGTFAITWSSGDIATIACAS